VEGQPFRPRWGRHEQSIVGKEAHSAGELPLAMHSRHGRHAPPAEACSVRRAAWQAITAPSAGASLSRAATQGLSIGARACSQLALAHDTPHSRATVTTCCASCAELVHVAVTDAAYSWGSSSTVSSTAYGGICVARAAIAAAATASCNAQRQHASAFHVGWLCWADLRSRHSQLWCVSRC
jgi:hypothetical protein